MQLKKWCDQYPKHVALVLRLTEMLHGKGHIVYGGDSYFTSVKALLEHGTYYLGMLKTASAGFPKKYLQSLAWNDDATRGETCTVQHTVKMKRVQKIIFGHAWNEPGTVGLPKKILCGSAHHTLSTDPHVKVRWQLNDVTGSSERITCTVPRTSAVKEYFQAACIIDEHNHLRQGGWAMEDAVATNDWWFRVFCTISGMCEVGAFKCFCLENNPVTPQNHDTFVEKLTVQLLTNNRAGAPEKTAEQVQVRKRNREAVLMEEEDEDCVDINAHEVISVADWKAQVGSNGKRSERESKHGTSVRCQVCPVGTRPNAYYCCLKCSNELGKPFAV